MSEATISLDSRDEAILLFGSRDQYLREIRTTLGMQGLVGRGDQILLKGSDDKLSQAERVFAQLRHLLRQQGSISGEDVKTVLEVVTQGGERIATAPAEPNAAGGAEGGSKASRYVRPRTDGQARYVKAMREHDLTICIGPAGTGKSWLAVGMAVSWLRAGGVKKIVLVRPAVEAGERLGYLPGDMIAKVNPYLRPLFDALNDMMEPEQVKRYMENDIIEVCPLAYMRGRAQPLSSPVLTTAGFRPIGEHDAGDMVIGSDGQPTIVMGVFPQGERPVYRVRCSDGTSTRCCAEHLWAVHLPDEDAVVRTRHVLSTQDMIDRLAASQQRLEIPLLSAPARLEAQAVSTEPYALGLSLGSQRWGVAAEANAAAGGRASVGLRSRRSKRRGRQTLPHAFVPQEYLHNTAEVRLAVLHGLLDGQRTTDADFTTTSRQLRDDVLFLARSLGGVATWSSTASEVYRIDIRLPDRSRADARANALARTVTSIEPDGVEPTVCIRVAAADSLYVTDDFILTHNTLNQAAIILDEGQNTTIAQMKMFLTRMGNGSKIIVTGDITQVDLPPHTKSGLQDAVQRLKSVERIALVHLDETDIVRNPLVAQILRAYEGDRPRKRKERNE